MAVEAISPAHKLIVLHTPKCGGSSLLGSLQDAFGRKAIYRDYKYIGGERMPKRADIPEPVIYGHFRAVKYNEMHGFRVTLLREPVDRMLSLYFNWRFSPPEPLQNRIGRLRNDVHAGRMSLLELAREPSIANRIHRHYFGGFDMARFSLIIPHHNYTSGVRRLGEMVGVPLSVQERNVSSSRSPEYEKARREVMADEETLHALKNLIGEEIDFYQRAMALPAFWQDNDGGAAA